MLECVRSATPGPAAARPGRPAGALLANTSGEDAPGQEKHVHEAVHVFVSVNVDFRQASVGHQTEPFTPVGADMK
ncbi:hypothetical protein AOLI_G00269900 [Acnodon oligacanthus]